MDLLISSLLATGPFLFISQVALVYANSIIATPFSWFIVIIPALIFGLVVQVHAVNSIIDFVDDLYGGSMLEKILCASLILLIAIAPIAFLLTTILLAAVGDYSIGIYYAFIPVLLIEVYALSVFVISFIFEWWESNVIRVKKFRLLTCVSLSVIFCQVMLCLTPWLKSYAWLSGLLPVMLGSCTIIFFIRVLY
jgi:hypothetical protein